MEPSQEINKENFRIQSVDLLRGAVMIIMAIDHVRVYSGLPAGGTEAGIFFTRWITHYCAPAFTFFAGTSAFLYFHKTQNKSEVAKFLLTRGILLVVLELTVIRFFWTFNFDYANFTLAGVIWMLGWCMIILSALVKLSPTTIGISGVAIVVLQRNFGFLPGIMPDSILEPAVKTWSFIYPCGSLGGALTTPSGLDAAYGITILYVIVPWIGVMMAGYGFGQLLLLEPAHRRKILLLNGIGAIIIFLYYAVGHAFSNDSASDLPYIFRVLNQQKYPASILFLLMTLGPLIALVPWAEKVKGHVADGIKVIGRVPMFYYILHILLIHISAFVVNLLLSGNIHQDWYSNAPLVWIPEEQRWSLPLLYIVWLIDVVILYIACRWYANYKANHPDSKWLKYL